PFLCQVEPLGTRGDRYRPIDAFFESLASLGERAAAVVVSGNGADGAAGVRTVRAAGGWVLVQDPRTARFDAMPKAAIHTGAAHRVLHAEEVAQALVERTRQRSSVTE